MNSTLKRSKTSIPEESYSSMEDGFNDDMSTDDIKAFWECKRGSYDSKIKIANINRLRRMPVDSSLFKLIKVAISISLIAFIGGIMTGQLKHNVIMSIWRVRFAPSTRFDQGFNRVSNVPLEKYRIAGEIAARHHQGVTAMGTSHSSAHYHRTDWSAAAHSCSPLLSILGGKRPKQVLVTGSAGFIGMHVAIELRKKGYGVIGIDNFNDYYPTSLKRARQAHAEAVGNVYIVDGDINDKDLLRKIMKTCGGFTHVVHMAAQAGVRYAASNPDSYVHANIAGHVSLLEVLADQKPIPPAIVYASSSSVYGMNTKSPFNEDDRVDTPASLYAATKRADELMANVYHSLYGLSMVGLRFFTVYGPWGRPDMAAFKFAIAIMKGEPVPIFKADGRELSRDFTYIDDAVAGVLSAVDLIPRSHSDLAVNEVYNIGNTHPHSVSDLVTTLEHSLGRVAERKSVPLPKSGDVLATYADISKARNVLGYDPVTPLSTGIGNFADWFFQYYGSALDPGADQPLDWKYKPL